MEHVPDASSLRRLRFLNPQERAFREEYGSNSLPQARFVLALSLSLFLLLALKNMNVVQAHQAEWLLYFGLNCACIGMAFVASFHPAFHRVMQPALAAVTCLIGSNLLYSMASYPDPATNQINLSPTPLIILIMAAYTFSTLRLLPAIAACWSLVAVYEVIALHQSDALHLPTFLDDNINLMIANLIGMVACHSREWYIRRDFLLTRQIEAEREKSERLLTNMLPGSIAARLKQGQATIADHFAEVTVLFADIVDFTPFTARVTPEDLVRLLNTLFSRFDALAEAHGMEKIKTIGDAYMAVAGLPEPQPDHAIIAADTALEMRSAIATLAAETGHDLRLRIGLHSGPVVAGVIGTHRFIYDLWGDTVNLASRMESQGVGGCIQISEATRALLGDNYAVSPRGLLEMKGRGEVVTYLLHEHSPLNASGGTE